MSVNTEVETVGSILVRYTNVLHVASSALVHSGKSRAPNCKKTSLGGIASASDLDLLVIVDHFTANLGKYLE